MSAFGSEMDIRHQQFKPNQTYRGICQPGQSIEGQLFEKRPVPFKEYGERVGTYGYVAEVIS